MHKAFYLALLLAVLACVYARKACAFHLREYSKLPRWKHVPDDFHHGGQRGNAWFQDNFEPAIRCIDDKRLGNWGDGGKYVCDPDCLLQNNNCTIWSVGSNNQFDFEDAMHPYGCSMHTFDHTNSGSAAPKYLTYHRIGLGPRSVGDIKTLMDMYKLTGSLHKIDVLKVDCEGCEYAAFLDPETLLFLSHHVLQLLVEIHFTSAPETEALAEALTGAGFRTFSKEPNIKWSDGSCIEYALLNVNLMLQ